MNRRRIIPALLLGLGLTQMAADLAGAPKLAALAFATALSPAPKVFTTQAGYEGFSTTFVLDVVTADGEAHAVRITPERYARVRGPYNRRNAFGAAIAGAPLLRARPELTAMLDDVTQHALCGDAPLLDELGVVRRADVTRVRLSFETRPSVEAPTPMEVRCR